MRTLLHRKCFRSCCCSVAKLCQTLLWAINCSMSSCPVPHHLLEFAQIHVHWIGYAIQPSHPLSSLSPPTFNFSQRQSLFQLALPFRWPKYWGFSLSICPSNGCSGLISFRFDLFDVLAVQGTLRSLFQHHSLKASMLWCSAFFMFQFSHPYMTAGKTIALTI